MAAGRRMGHGGEGWGNSLADTQIDDNKGWGMGSSSPLAMRRRRIGGGLPLGAKVGWWWQWCTRQWRHGIQQPLVGDGGPSSLNDKDNWAGGVMGDNGDSSRGHRYHFHLCLICNWTTVGWMYIGVTAFYKYCNCIVTYFTFHLSKGVLLQGSQL